MARLDTAQFEVRLENAKLEEVVREVVASMHNEIDERAVQIDAGDALPEIALDRRLMKLAIKQLLGNALKYSPPGSPIRIRLHSSDPGITLEITDHGKGIPMSEQGRIFERFYRSPAVTHRIPGSGLGLTIAHRIVQAHHGELTVNSRPGETTFRIVLPAGARA
jgi:two-component system sensor histidine kinase KdpD